MLALRGTAVTLLIDARTVSLLHGLLHVAWARTRRQYGGAGRSLRALPATRRLAVGFGRFVAGLPDPST
jgi:hypothetical protein